MAGRFFLIVALMLLGASTPLYAQGADSPTNPLPFATVMTAGGGHTCGITTAGAAYCWGEHRQGQLGSATTDSTTTPAALAGSLRFTRLSLGKTYTCGITTGGAAYCWGDIDSAPTTCR